jgi:hypothetical protein
MRKPPPAYPLLLTALPALHIAASNPGQTRLSDVALVLAVMLVGFAAVYFVVYVSLSRIKMTWLAPVVVTAILVVFFSIKLLDLTPETIHPVVVPGLLAILITLLIWLSRHSRATEALNRFLETTAILVVGWSVLAIGINLKRERHDLVVSNLAKDITTPVRIRPRSDSLLQPRVIYLIVLDEYANSKTLHQQIGFDNRQFEDSLRKLGFVIPMSVRSNYPHTTLSLPSLLNFAHLTPLTRELGNRETDPFILNYLVQHNRAIGYLKGYGYKFVLFPSEWWPSTAHSPQADREFEVWHHWTLSQAVARTELRRHLWDQSLMALMGRVETQDPDFLQATFDGLRRLDTRGERTFVFAHLLLPHTPYVFDAKCRRRFGGWGADRRLYLDQLQCTNKLTLELVTTLLRRPGPPPVILLQGDHGTQMLQFNEAPSAKAVTPAQARERFGAFGAYFLPGYDGQPLGDSLTLVNLFPKVLNLYFGAGLPLESDDLYMSLGRTPFNLVRIDPDSLQDGSAR